MSRAAFRLAGALLVLALAACDRDITPPPPPTEPPEAPEAPEPRAVGPSSVTLRIGETAALEAVGENVSWSTSNPRVATIASDGVLTARGVGQVVIEAVDDQGDRGYAFATVSMEGSPPAAVLEPRTFQPDWQDVWTDGDEIVLVGNTGPRRDPRPVVHSFDGERWTFPRIEIEAALRSIWGTSAEQLIVGDAVVVRRNAGGLSIACEVSDQLTTVWGWAEGSAITAGTGVYWYHDGQCTPADLSDVLPPPFTIRAAAGSGPDDIYLVGEPGLVHVDVPHPGRMADQTVVLHFDGTSWRRIDPPGEPGTMRLYDMEVLGPEAVFAFGTRSDDERPVYHVLRYDGDDWSPVPVPEPKGALVASWSDGTEIVAVRSVVGVAPHTGVRYDGETWSTIDIPGDGGLLAAVTGTSPDDLVVAGERGPILTYRSGSWSRNDFEYTTDVWAASRDRAFAVGRDGAVVWDGHVWRSLPELPRGLRKVWGLGPDQVYVAGEEGRVYRFDGEAWEVILAGEFITGVWAAAPDDVFLTSLEGAVRHWDGTTVETVFEAGTQLQGIWGSGPEDIFVVGGSLSRYGEVRPTVARFDGERWQTLPLPIEDAVVAVWGARSDDVYALTRRVLDDQADPVHLLHYDGTGWAVVDGLPDLGAGVLSGAGPEAIYLQARGGPLLIYDGTAGAVVAEIPRPDNLAWGPVWGDEHGLALIGGSHGDYAVARPQ